MTATIRLADSDEDILRCLPVMRQLRTELTDEEFVPRVRRQEAGGYRLVLAESGGAVRAVAGFRIIDNLAGGRILYVDDLVTDAAERSRGHGRALLEWLVERAREEGCRNLELDSGVQRFDAHRFYLANRMVISSHHFRLKL
ncbi:MAG TPA: GNAT family N-acetyltransferase [Longimicrobiaceae bacterium]|nr:GNAT family N-acetyltransferase [Longimicrobiaceae bacterium]